MGDQEHRQPQRVAQADVVITTALIPGRAAPILLTADHALDAYGGPVRRV